MYHRGQLMLLILSILLCFSTPIFAAKQPTSYCKCICFQNSTIIPLNSPPSESPPSPSSSSSHSKSASRLSLRADDNDDAASTKQKHHTLTCNDCNRAFCLDYKLPICKNAKEEDVFAQCFQRDSLKDRTIVTLFIVATSSLLGWALVKPFVVKTGVGDVVQRYTPLGHRSGLSGTSEDGDLSGLDSAGNARRTQGYVGDADGSRTGRQPDRGRGSSISRQGGLNS